MFGIVKLEIFFAILSGFSINGFCQVKEIIDKDISIIINKAPDANASKVKNRRCWLKGREYREIMALDTLAIPYLVEKISDTTQTSIRIPCATHKLKTGDVAFALLNNIVPIPWNYAFGLQGDSFSCDALPDGGWEDIYNDRIKKQKQLKDFFASSRGKAWVKLFTAKPGEAEKQKLFKELQEK